MVGISGTHRAEPLCGYAVCLRMATTTKRNRGSDRGRISSQRHEISYAGKKLGARGAARVRKAKKSLGRKTSRRAVMARAKRG